MTFQLDRVVPWGRSLDEYRVMFGLDDATLLRGPILGCGDGPASFQAEARALGARVVSCDPLYRCSAEALARRIEHVGPVVLEQTRANRDEFVWTHVRSLEHLAELRRLAMQRFIVDYGEHQRRGTGRYVCAGLPVLPFSDRRFDLALCSHFLFLYSQQFDLDFHVAALTELCRVAREVRVFPLAQLGAEPSPWLEPARRQLARGGVQTELRRVDYEFQRGADQLLVAHGTPMRGA